MNDFPYQYDASFSKDYQDFGCYVHCIAKTAFEEGGFQDSDIRTRINVVMENAKKNGYITSDFEVRNPEKIFLLYGLLVKYTDRHEPPERMCSSDEREILCFARDPKDKEGKPVRITHFVTGDGNGNIVFDPLRKSITATYGFLLSKRIFKILGRV